MLQLSVVGDLYDARNAFPSSLKKNLIKGVEKYARPKDRSFFKILHEMKSVNLRTSDGELDVIPDIVMSGALQHIDHLHVDWTRCY